MTFQASPRARQVRAALSQLRLGFDLDHASAEGFESLSDFQDAFAKVFGESAITVAPGRVVHVAWVDTPLGPMVGASNDEALILLEFTDRRRMEAQVETLKKRFNGGFVLADDRIIRQTRRELGEYFAAKRKDFSVPIAFPGTLFETRVWNQLVTIPYGETISYEDLAVRIGSKGAVRAVGSANGRNRLTILVPCHRVVNKSGGLGGYGGGLWRKRMLLDLERRNR